MYTLTAYKPDYVMMSSDFSQQEPKLLGFVARDKRMCEAFAQGRDIYATIASIAYKMPYEDCLEFNPKTGEYQPDGKARRSEAKTIVLGISYGRSVPSIGEQLYSHRDDMTDDEKTKEAQRVYDSVMNAFPSLENLMKSSQHFAHVHGYTETILGRRRHLPDMKLDEFEFKPLPEYVNPDIDPLDMTSLENAEQGIPEYKIKELKKEFSKYKYYGQIAKRTKQLYEEEHIKVINNRPKINDAKRQCVNCVDDETEILTLDGWKSWSDGITQGTKILSYNINKNCLEEDEVLEVHEQSSDEGIEVWHLYNRAFDAVCTENHRWVTRTDDVNELKYRFYETSHLLKVNNPRYQILRNYDIKDTYKMKNDDENIQSFANKILENELSYNDILTCEKKFAYQVYCYLYYTKANKGSIKIKSLEVCDKLQVLALLVGKVANRYDNITGKGYSLSWTFIGKPYNQVARIKSLKKEKTSVNHVWCVTTNNGTWVARRSGKYYITGNSIVQGSAADFTKMALIKLMRDPRWKEVGGEILTVVHDEIIAQVPAEYAKEGGEVLKSDMEGAGSFLPFPIKCDVTTTYRWYGLEIPCSFEKPKDLSLESENDISWVQWHLVEMGFELPNFKDKDGNDPIGDAAHGVSGQISDTMMSAINEYCDRYHISKDSFIDDIKQRVETGIVER